MLTFATNILRGKETAAIIASGSGNIKSRKNNGKRIVPVTCRPKRKRVNPTMRKKREKPEIEKT